MVKKALVRSRARSTTPSNRSLPRSKTPRNASAVKKSSQRSTSAVRSDRRSYTTRTPRTPPPVLSDTAVGELLLRLIGHETEITKTLSQSDVFDAFELFLEKTRIKRGPQYQAFVTELQAWMGHQNNPGQIPKLKYPEFITVVTQWFTKHRPEFLRILPIKHLETETYALLLIQIARDFELVKTYIPAKATEIDAKVQKSQDTIAELLKAVASGKGLAELKLSAKHLIRDGKGVVRLIAGLKGETSTSIKNFYREAIAFYKSQLKLLQAQTEETSTLEGSKRTTSTSRQTKKSALQKKTTRERNTTPQVRSATPGRSATPHKKSTTPQNKKIRKKSTTPAERSFATVKSKATNNSKKSVTPRKKTMRKKSVTPRGKSATSTPRSISDLPRNKSAIPRNRSATPGIAQKRESTPQRTVSAVHGARDKTPKKTTAKKSVISTKNMKEYQTQNKLFGMLQKLQTAFERDAKEDIAVLGGEVLDLREILMNIWKEADTGETYISTVEPFAKPCNNLTIKNVKTDLFNLTKFKKIEKNMRAGKENSETYLGQLSKQKDSLVKAWLTPLETPQPKPEPVNVGLSPEEVLALKEMIGELEQIRQKRLTMNTSSNLFEARASVSEIGRPETRNAAVGNEGDKSDSCDMHTTFGENDDFTKHDSSAKNNKNLDQDQAFTHLSKIEEETNEVYNPITRPEQQENKEKLESRHYTNSEFTSKERNSLGVDRSNSQMLSIQPLKKYSDSVEQTDLSHQVEAIPKLEKSRSSTFVIDTSSHGVNVESEDSFKEKSEKTQDSEHERIRDDHNNMQVQDENDKRGFGIHTTEIGIQKSEPSIEKIEANETEISAKETENLQEEPRTSEYESGVTDSINSQSIRNNEEVPVRKMLYYIPENDTTQTHKVLDRDAKMKHLKLNIETEHVSLQIENKENPKLLSKENEGFVVSSSENIGIEPSMADDTKAIELVYENLASTPSLNDIHGGRKSDENEIPETKSNLNTKAKEFTVSHANGLEISSQRLISNIDTKDSVANKTDETTKLDIRKENEIEISISPIEKEEVSQKNISSLRNELTIAPSVEEISLLSSRQDLKGEEDTNKTRNYHEIHQNSIEIDPRFDNRTPEIKLVESKSLPLSPIQEEESPVSERKPEPKFITISRQEDFFVKTAEINKKVLDFSSADNTEIVAKPSVLNTIPNEENSPINHKEKNLKNTTGDEITIHSQNKNDKETNQSLTISSRNEVNFTSYAPKTRRNQMAYHYYDLFIQANPSQKKPAPIKNFNVSSGDTMGIAPSNRKTFEITPSSASQNHSFFPSPKLMNEYLGETLTIEPNLKNKNKDLNTAQNSLDIQQERKRPPFIMASNSEMTIPSHQKELRLPRNTMFSPNNEGIMIERSYGASPSLGARSPSLRYHNKDYDISRSVLNENLLRNQFPSVQVLRNLNYLQHRPQERAFGELSSRRNINRDSNEALPPLKIAHGTPGSSAYQMSSVFKSIYSPDISMMKEPFEQFRIPNRVKQMDLKDSFHPGIGIPAPFNHREQSLSKNIIEIIDISDTSQHLYQEEDSNDDSAHYDQYKDQTNNHTKYEDSGEPSENSSGYREMDIEDFAQSVEEFSDLSIEKHSYRDYQTEIAHDVHENITEKQEIAEAERLNPRIHEAERLNSRIHEAEGLNPRIHETEQMSVENLIPGLLKDLKPIDSQRTNLSNQEDLKQELVSATSRNLSGKDYSDFISAQDSSSEESETAYKTQEHLLIKLQDGMVRSPTDNSELVPPSTPSVEDHQANDDNHRENQASNFISPDHSNLAPEDLDESLSEQPSYSDLNPRSPRSVVEPIQDLKKQPLDISESEKELLEQEEPELKTSYPFASGVEKLTSHVRNSKTFHNHGIESPQFNPSNTYSLQNSSNHSGSLSSGRLPSNPLISQEDSDKTGKTDKRLRELIGVYKYIRSEREKNGENLDKVNEMIHHYSEQLNKLDTARRAISKPVERKEPAKSDFIGQQFAQYSSNLGHIDLGAFLRFCSDFNILKKKNMMSEKELSNKLLLKLFDTFSNLHGEMDEEMFRHVFKRLADCYFDNEYDLINSTNYSRLSPNKKVEFFSKELSKRSYKKGKNLAPVASRNRNPDDVLKYNLSEGMRKILSPKKFYTKTSFN